MASSIVVNLTAGQLAALIGVIGTLLPILIFGIGVITIFMSISDKMTALEWTTLCKISGGSPFTSCYGVGGQPALTGIKLWGTGSYKRNILYLLIGICPLLLCGSSAIAPLGIHTCSVTKDVKSTDINVDIVETDPFFSLANNNSFSLKELTQIRVCGAFKYMPCPGIKDGLYVDDAYAVDFNRTYSNFAMRYRSLKTSTSSSNGNISYPSQDFRMSVVTSTQRGHNIIDRMIVDHDNGGILMNKAVKPKHKVGEKFNWSIKGIWLQPHVSCKSTNLTQIAENNKTGIIDNWIGRMEINNADLRPSQLYPLGDKGQTMNLSLRSSRYSQFIQDIVMKKLNMTTNGSFYKSPVYRIATEPGVISTYRFPEFPDIMPGDIRSDDASVDTLCKGFGGGDNVAENIVGVKCWKFLGPPKTTERGIEQTLYGCASMVEASMKSINLQSNETNINIISDETIPAKWYIEKGNLSINDMDPWWGGVKLEEDIPKNSVMVSTNSLLIPAGTSFVFGLTADAQPDAAVGSALDKMSKIEDRINGYMGNGLGNLALFQQWKEEGTTEEGINRMFQRQWTDIMINMVTPTNEAEITGRVQLLINKTCYDLRYATQYYVAVIGLIAILCMSLISINKTKSFTTVKHTVRQMDLGRVILNIQDRAEASTDKSSKWVKTDGKKLISIDETGFIKPKDLDNKNYTKKDFI